ncbi:helix-turn-helix domain-containing protein [Paenibacillus segetis]|uniref:DNA-binding response regulator n=1 Tax=Paenibacillus segetis TaxID=1325360 RepID=A0ABQ1YLD2_9BACL|nr:helix-turn-helix domain-containing protein [Paenibacillus segetis]GGH28828.1 DNA-binding response regulator [Paenibacillus segetis]
MIKVMIVDDDLLVRNNLKYMLSTELPQLHGSSEFILCGEANDGREALDKISDYAPDIILSDMKMPNMDGLILCEALHTRYPDIQFIALSNYDDFNYVHGTLQNGAVDYILKHKMSAVTLIAALRKASRSLIQNSKQPDHALDINNINALKQDFLIYLLTGFYSDVDEISAHMDTLGLKLDLTQVLVIVMCIDDYQSMDLKKTTLLQFSVINIASEILEDQRNGAICHIANENYAILLSFADIFSQQKIQDIVQNTMSRLSSCMKNFLNLSVSFSIGQVCSQIHQLPQSYLQAEKKLKNKFYYDAGAVFTNTDEQQGAAMLNYFDIKKESTLSHFISIQDREGIHTVLSNLFSEIRANKPPLAIAQMVFTDLLSLINKTCKNHSIDLREVYADNILPEKHLSDFSSLSSVQDWLLSLFERLCDALTMREAAPTSIYVREALDYIHLHFAEDISLSLVADKINISNVYLSKLFKQEIGIGFAEYLTKYRLKLAQSLLRQHQLSIHDIAAASGFNDYIYFLKTFKKHIGVTPTEYVKNDVKG